LRELLKGKELKIRQLEYENGRLKKKDTIQTIHPYDDDSSPVDSPDDSPIDEIRPEISA